MLYSSSLQVFVEAMEKFPNAVLGLSSSLIQDNLPYPFELTPRELFKAFYVLNRPYLTNGPSSAIIRRDAFEYTGKFSGLRFAGDLEMWLKLASIGNIDFI